MTIGCKGIIGVGTAIICSQVLSPAWADDAVTTANSGAATTPGTQLETIVVTASKRKEDVRKVPLSVTVIGGEALEDQHITDITDLTRAVPNLSFSGGQQGGGSGLSNIELRGVSSQAGSSTVGIYLDDVSMTTRNLYSLGGAEPKFFDIDHVEVLRGPQGTLYGASSMGGTVKFVTNQPSTSNTETNVTAEVSSTQHGGINDTVSAVHNAPLVPGVLGLRFGVQSTNTSGYIDQVSQANPTQVIATGINSEKDLVLRAAVKWTPNAQLTVTPSIFYQKVNSDGMDVSHPNAITSYTGTPGIALAPNQTDQLIREPAVDKLFVPSLTVTYDTGTADLTSVTSYFKRDFNRTMDGQAANSTYLATLISDTNLAATVYSLPAAVLLENSVQQFSQEFRLASKPYDGKGSPFVWLTGAYFSKLKTRVTDNEPIYGINQAFTAASRDITSTADLQFAFLGDFPNDNAYFSERRYTEEQTALFGEISYYLTPALRLTAGARQLHATESMDRDGNYYFAGGPVPSSFSGTYNSFTPKFAASWDVDPANTVFASATKGFRLGGANRAIPMSICGADLQNLGLNGPPGTFESDSLWSYEAGNKSRFLDNRLSVNASLFYVKWKNIQQDVLLPCTFDFEGNFGNATSKGAEIEVRARPTSNLTLSLFGGYTRATFDEAVPALGTNSGGAPFVNAGDQLQGVPKMNAALTGDYRFFTGYSVTGFLRGAVRWTGTSRGSSFDPANPDYSRPSYKTVDASIGATFANNWEVSLFAKNLLNDQTILQQPMVQYALDAYRQRPRTIGINLSGRM